MVGYKILKYSGSLIKAKRFHDKTRGDVVGRLLSPHHVFLSESLHPPSHSLSPYDSFFLPSSPPLLPSFFRSLLPSFDRPISLSSTSRMNIFGRGSQSSSSKPKPKPAADIDSQMKAWSRQTKKVSFTSFTFPYCLPLLPSITAFPSFRPLLPSFFFLFPSLLHSSPRVLFLPSSTFPSFLQVFFLPARTLPSFTYSSFLPFLFASFCVLASLASFLIKKGNSKH